MKNKLMMSLAQLHETIKAEVKHNFEETIPRKDQEIERLKKDAERNQQRELNWGMNYNALLKKAERLQKIVDLWLEGKI